MSWQTLPPVNLTQEGGYVPIPLAGAGGRLPLQIPPFPMEDTGLYEVGIYDLPQGGPAGLVSVPQTAQIARYTRSLVFEVPPNITAPHVGLRLISHEEIETASYLIACKWQMPYGSGTGNGGGTPVPSGFMAAISWTEIKQAAIAEIAQGYATIESVTTGLSEVQEAIDALAAQNSINSATQQAIAAITTRIQALESSDPEQVEAIATLQQAIADLVAEGTTDEELAAGLSAIQSQLGALANDAELEGAIGPIQAAIDSLGGTYATDSELAAAVVPLATKAELTGAIAPFVTKKNATFLHSFSSEPGGISVRDYAVAGGYSWLEIAPTFNCPLGKGLIFSSHTGIISAGGSFRVHESFGAGVGVFGNTGNFGGAENSVRLGADSVNAYLYTMKYAGSPYPPLTLSARGFTFRVGNGAWAEQSGWGAEVFSISSVGGAKFFGISSTTVNMVVQASPAQSVDLQQWVNSSGAALARITANGGFSPASMAAESANNNTIYFSATAGKLCYKDPAGNINTLY
jgi:hypothetical protein